MSATTQQAGGPRAIDLFCGAGGAAKGLQRAGFHVTGVDIKPQPRYCGDAFIRADALTVDLAGFDFVWASPPCQAFTPLRAVAKREHPDLVADTRRLLESAGVPWIIENVPQAPLNYCVTLCGASFGLRVYRHRRFESNVLLFAPPHQPHAIRATGRQRQRKAHYEAGGFITITGDVGTYCGPAMGIDWMNGDELSQAIPPAYSEFLGRQIMSALLAARAA